MPDLVSSPFWAAFLVFAAGLADADTGAVWAVVFAYACGPAPELAAVALAAPVAADLVLYEIGARRPATAALPRRVAIGLEKSAFLSIVGLKFLLALRWAAPAAAGALRMPRVRFLAASIVGTALRGLVCAAVSYVALYLSAQGRDLSPILPGVLLAALLVTVVARIVLARWAARLGWNFD